MGAFFTVVFILAIVLFIVYYRWQIKPALKYLSDYSHAYFIRFKSGNRPDFNAYPNLKNQMEYKEYGRSNYKISTNLTIDEISKFVAKEIGISQDEIEVCNQNNYLFMIR